MQSMLQNVKILTTQETINFVIIFLNLASAFKGFNFNTRIRFTKKFSVFFFLLIKFKNFANKVNFCTYLYHSLFVLH